MESLSASSTISSTTSTDQTNSTGVRSFNLVKAQKYVDKLAAHIKENASSSSANIWSRKKTSNSFNPFENGIVKVSTGNSIYSADHYRDLVETQSEFIKNSIDVYKNLKMLRNLIYDVNAAKQISGVLTRLNILADIKNAYTKYKESILANKTNTLTNDTLEAAVKRESSISVDYWLPVYTVTQINKKVEELNREIAALEDQRDKLNATTVITFDFCPMSLQVLGI